MARICLIRQGKFPFDPRLVHQVDALVALGHEVDLICLTHPGAARVERNGPFTIRRLPIPKQRAGRLAYLVEYGAFLVAAGTLAAWRHLRRRYDLIQVNSIPDSLVWAALVPRLLGARVLLDLCESMPEFLATKFGVAMTDPSVRLVARVEQAAIRFADFATTCTIPMRQAFVARGASPEKVAIVMNSYGLSYGNGATMPATPNGAGNDAFVLVCHGTIEERYGLDTLLHAVALLREEIPELRVEIIGEGSFRPKLIALRKALDLERQVSISPGWIPMEDLLRAIASADVGVVAIKRDVCRDLVLCTKMFDFIGMGKPAIVSRTRAVEEYFGQSSFEMFTADDPQDLAQAIRNLHADPARRRRLANEALTRSEEYSWSSQRDVYQGIVQSLVNRRKPERLKPSPRPGEIRGRHMINVTHSVRVKGVGGVAARAGMILTRFGPTPRHMDRALSRYVEITERYGTRPTLPVTASVLGRHPELISRYLDRGVEFAVHGMVHGDHCDQSYEEQVENIAQAGAVFGAAGVPYTGFRAPYLRSNEATDRALQRLGFRYNSSQAVAFPVLPGDLDQPGRTGYQRALAYYGARDAAVVAVRPREIGGLVQIPVAVPDDEIMVDRLRLDDQVQASVWRAILDRTYARDELFTIQLHPERIFRSGYALEAILAEARQRTPRLWLATLDEIASWWLARRDVRLRVSRVGVDRYQVEVTGDPRATVIGSNLVDTHLVAWWGREGVIQGPRVEITSARKPVVGISSRTPAAVLDFLAEEGFICELAADRNTVGAYVDVAGGSWQEATLLKALDDAPGPLVRLARWPDAARGAVAVTGDVDSITLQDFAARLYETSESGRRRRHKNWSAAHPAVLPG